MTIIQELIKPTVNKKPDFTTGSTLKDSYEFNCIKCESELELNLDNQIRNSWQGKTENISPEEENEIKTFYRIGLYRKAIDGGLAVFDKLKCENCESEYVTYCGVYEFSNSLYNVFVHGIVLIEN